MSTHNVGTHNVGFGGGGLGVGAPTTDSNALSNAEREGVQAIARGVVTVVKAPFRLIAFLGREFVNMGTRLVQMCNRPAPHAPITAPEALRPHALAASQAPNRGQVITNANLERAVSSCLTSPISQKAYDDNVTAAAENAQRDFPRDMLTANYQIKASNGRTILEVPKRVECTGQDKIWAADAHNAFISSELTPMAQEIVRFSFTQSMSTVVSNTVGTALSAQYGDEYFSEISIDDRKISFSETGCSVELDLGVSIFSTNPRAVFGPERRTNPIGFPISNEARVKVRIDFSLERNEFNRQFWKPGNMTVVSTGEANASSPRPAVDQGSLTITTAQSFGKRFGPGIECRQIAAAKAEAEAKTQRETENVVARYDRLLARSFPKRRAASELRPEESLVNGFAHPQPTTTPLDLSQKRFEVLGVGHEVPFSSWFG